MRTITAATVACERVQKRLDNLGICYTVATWRHCDMLDMPVICEPMNLAVVIPKRAKHYGQHKFSGYNGLRIGELAS
jgi:hypothetical protein